MKIRSGALASLASLAPLASLALLAMPSCVEPPKPPPISTPPTETSTPPAVATEPPREPAPPPAAAAPGTRTVLAARKNDDTWDRMLVAGGRLYALTDVNRWTSGPMYVPAARLWSVPIAGGELMHHLDLEGLASLVADDASLYVAVNRDLSKMGTSQAKMPTGRIFRLPLGGGAPVNVATSIQPQVVALDGATLWFDGFRMPKDGSKSPALSGVKNPMTFAFDDEYVYFTTGKGDNAKPDGKNGRVLRMPKKGGTTTVLATGLPDEPGGLAVDASHVYVTAVAWTSPALENAGVIARVKKEGGDLEILAKDQPSLRNAWLSGDDLYVVSGRTGRPGSVLRVKKEGGPVETVVSDPTLRHATDDGTSIYFASDGTFRAQPAERLTPAVLLRLVK